MTRSRTAKEIESIELETCTYNQPRTASSPLPNKDRHGLLPYVDPAAARHACAGLVLSLLGRLRLVRGPSPLEHARVGLRAARIPAALAWFIQPWALVLTTSWLVAVLYWRDSRSTTLATRAGPMTGKGLP